MSAQGIGSKRTDQGVFTLRSGDDRGHFDHGWLDTHHTFSFGSYQDSEWMGFGVLRVINEDVIAPRMGFGEHGHRDMEIITYPVSGVVRHRDSLGNEEDITPGMIQRMSAGSGIQHSEFNPSDEKTHMLQIWIEPKEAGITPTHESRVIAIEDKPGRLHVLVSPDGVDGSMVIQQDATMSAGVFDSGDSVGIDIGVDRRVWVQVIRGSMEIRDGDGARVELVGGDGVGVSRAEAVEIGFHESSEILVFELA